MAKGKVSEDVLKLIVEADTSKIQQEIHKTKKSLKDLQKERKSLDLETLLNPRQSLAEECN